MLKAFSFILFLSLVLCACNRSCVGSTCSVSGSTGYETCRCATHEYGYVKREYALCQGQGATYVDMNVGGYGCSTNGQGTKAQLETKSREASYMFVPRCTASSATQCSQTLQRSGCQISGQNAKCSSEFFTHGSLTWLIPKCQAYAAHQCSITCGGIYSCSKQCGSGKYAYCRCGANQNTGYLQANCGCSNYP
ncbi:hypothetical protein RCL1_006578 [Eukaryota sp. TZLM3-RCL]